MEQVGNAHSRPEMDKQHSISWHLTPGYKTQSYITSRNLIVLLPPFLALLHAKYILKYTALTNLTPLDAMTL